MRRRSFLAFVAAAMSAPALSGFRIQNHHVDSGAGVTLWEEDILVCRACDSGFGGLASEMYTLVMKRREDGMYTLVMNRMEEQFWRMS